MTPAALHAVLAAATDPAPDTARDQLARELRRAEYREPLGERAMRWLQELVDRLGDAAAGSGPLGLVGALLVVVVLVSLLALALSRLRRVEGRAAGSSPVFAAQRRTALEHRRAAQDALAGGRHDEAVLEAVRALTAGLVERGLLVDSVGLTVREATATAAGRFPDLSSPLGDLRDTFDDIRYGGRAAVEADGRRAVEVERAVSEATPTSGGRPVDQAPVPS